MKRILNNKKIYIYLILLLAIITIICLVIINNKNHNTENDFNISNTKTNYTNIISYLQLNTLPDEYYGYFYKKEEVTTDTIPNNIKIYMAIRKIITANKLKNNIEIKASDVEDALVSIFGTNVKYNHQSITGNNNSYTTFKYDKGIYKEDKTKCDDICNNPRTDSIISNIVKVDNTDNSTIVYEQVAFVSTGYDPDTKKITYYIYKDIDKKELVSKEDSYSIDNCKDKLNTYKYTFKKDKDNYYFERVELVK